MKSNSFGEVDLNRFVYPYQSTNVDISRRVDLTQKI